MSLCDYVTVRIAGRLFGVETRSVQDVFYPRNITPVPLAGPEIMGVLNLRGRIVTAICARRRLGVPAREEGAAEPKAVGIEIGGDNYGLVVDQVETVLKLESEQMLPAPSNLPQRWSEVIQGVFRMQEELLVVLDVRKLLVRDTAVVAGAA